VHDPPAKEGFEGRVPRVSRVGRVPRLGLHTGMNIGTGLDTAVTTRAKSHERYEVLVSMCRHENLIT